MRLLRGERHLAHLPPIGASSLVTRTSSFQTLTTATETILTWQNEVRDELGIINLGSSTTLLTIVEAGLYGFDFLVTLAAEGTFSTAGTNVRTGRLSINGNPASLDNLIGYSITAAIDGGTTIPGKGFHLLAAGDTIQLNASQASGESLAVTGQRLTVVRLSA